jgi:hypothetical protein
MKLETKLNDVANRAKSLFIDLSAFAVVNTIKGCVSVGKILLETKNHNLTELQRAMDQIPSMGGYGGLFNEPISPDLSERAKTVKKRVVEHSSFLRNNSNDTIAPTTTINVVPNTENLSDIDDKDIEKMLEMLEVCAAKLTDQANEHTATLTNITDHIDLLNKDDEYFISEDKVPYVKTNAPPYVVKTEEFATASRGRIEQLKPENIETKEIKETLSDCFLKGIQ